MATPSASPLNQPAESSVCSPALPCSDIMTSYNVVSAYSNGVDQCTADACDPPTDDFQNPYGPQFLCTELVDRYYNTICNIGVTN